MWADLYPVCIVQSRRIDSNRGLLLDLRAEGVVTIAVLLNYYLTVNHALDSFGIGVDSVDAKHCSAQSNVTVICNS